MDEYNRTGGHSFSRNSSGFIVGSNASPSSARQYLVSNLDRHDTDSSSERDETDRGELFSDEEDGMLSPNSNLTSYNQSKLRHSSPVRVSSSSPNSVYGASFPPQGYHSHLSPQMHTIPQQHSHEYSSPSRNGLRSRRNDRKHQSRQIIPERTTKNTQKLVLFPEDSLVSDSQVNHDEMGVLGVRQVDDTDGAMYSRDPFHEVLVPDNIPDLAKTEAERLKKEARHGIPRATCYCLAESFKMEDLNKTLKDHHHVTPKKYDECVYVSYEPATKEKVLSTMTRRLRPTHLTLMKPVEVMHDIWQLNRSSISGMAGVVAGDKQFLPVKPAPYASVSSLNGNAVDEMLNSNLLPMDSGDEQGPHAKDVPNWMARSEVFLFDYGVVVLWNFTQEEEEFYLGFLQSYGVNNIVASLIEIEDFHFQYDLQGSFQPRIFNDMITLKSRSPLIKLTISHGLAQSVKLALFENMMEETIDGTAELPRMMAKFGTVKMSRSEIMKIVGRLFKLKINVNLISNVLDTPEVFWSEPDLEVLYNAVRGYLEINQRAKLLNNRADVLTDLLDMLSDHLHSNEMTWITWIIIILICVAVVIAIGEVVVKFVRLSAGMED